MLPDPEESSTEWYLQSGAAATAKGLVIGRMLLSHVAEKASVPELTVAAFHRDESIPKIYLYEGFVAGKYKSTPLWDVSQDEWDAAFCALAYAGQLGTNAIGYESRRFESALQLEIILHWETIVREVGLDAAACKGACPTVGLKKVTMPDGSAI